ncbi:MAG: hypothetical protein VYC17_06915 [Nitrospinota bacterium]|nr:hypothetical protein [Nitrospinota bacterium]
MIKVKCYSGIKVNERPVSFSLYHHAYQVCEIIDRWYGKNSVHFKVKADDGNIYLLKYDEWQDKWDLVFYQNPRKLKILLPQNSELSLYAPPHCGDIGAEQSTALN